MSARRADPQLWQDHELLAAAAERDGGAFAAFYRRHLPAVLAYLMRETADREQSADLAAEVFSAVLLAASRYEPQHDTALPWVLGIARNKLLMSFRRGRIESRARHRLGLEPVAMTDASLDRVDALASAGSGVLEQMLEALPYLEREAVRSHVVDELNYREIATQMECSELVVRKRVSRGLKKLRDQTEGMGAL